MSRLAFSCVLAIIVLLIASALSAEFTSRVTSLGDAASGASLPVPLMDSAVRASVASPASALDRDAMTRSRTDSFPTPTSRVAASSSVLPAARTTTPRAGVLVVPRGNPRTLDRDEQDVALAVTEAASEFGVDGARMLALMACESRGDVNAIGDGGLALSLFQWHARTWWQYAPQLGYEVRDVFSVIPQARLTAWALANGRGYLWTCWDR